MEFCGNGPGHGPEGENLYPRLRFAASRDDPLLMNWSQLAWPLSYSLWLIIQCSLYFTPQALDLEVAGKNGVRGNDSRGGQTCKDSTPADWATIYLLRNSIWTWLTFKELWYLDAWISVKTRQGSCFWSINSSVMSFLSILPGILAACFVNSGAL